MGGADEQAIRGRFRLLSGELDERRRRLWAAAEARSIGRGGIALVARVTGLSQATIRRGMRELESGGDALAPERVRRPGGGRKRLADKDPALLEDLDQLLAEDAGSLGGRAHSVRALAKALEERGHHVHFTTVAKLLRARGHGAQASDEASGGRSRAERGKTSQVSHARPPQPTDERTKIPTGEADRRRRAVGRAPTVVDVAREAGVSKTTVSAVIRGRTHVAPQLRERVLAAVDALGYRPNATARYLRLQRSDILGLVVGDLLDPFISEMTAHIEKHAAAKGFKVLLATSGGDRDAKAEGVRNLLEHPVAGVIFVAFSGDERMVRMVGPETPAIFVAIPSDVGPSITVDDAKGGDLATSHLVELGHRRIGYVSTNTLGPEPEIDEARATGYRQALRRAGLVHSDDLELRLGPMPGGQRKARMRELLAAPDRPTAVFAASDNTAVELMECARELGLRVPDDVSVVGFDNVQLAAIEMISLTTVAQPIEEFARLAVAMVTSPLEDRAELPPTTTVLPPKLVVRNSAAPPRSLKR